MARLTLALIVTAAGVTTAVTHPQKRPVAAAAASVPRSWVPRRMLARASRGERRRPLPVNAAPQTQQRRRPTTPPRPGRGRPAGSGRLDWRALAYCESTGDPRAVSPDGRYFGLYQFDLGTWRGVGGRGNPADASPAEQTYRAQLLYAQRGRAPWPVCGRFL